MYRKLTSIHLFLYYTTVFSHILQCPYQCLFEKKLEDTMRKIVRVIMRNPYCFLYTVLLTIVLLISNYGLKNLYTEVFIQKIEKNGIDYEAFRRMDFNGSTLIKAEEKIKRLIKKYPQLNGYPYMDSIGYLTFHMLANEFQGSEIVNEQAFIQGIVRLANKDFFEELYYHYKGILSDLRYFPIPLMDGEDDISYVDSWNGIRNYGGKRRHEGTDLMDLKNRPGFYPVVSMTDGIVENLGWLEQGGWRIGIRTPLGAYFYYAHLDSFANDLMVGNRVFEGQLLGFMGDSGYGEEGTTGQFPTHLHLGIYVNLTNMAELSVNPYPILRLVESNRIQSFYEK